MLKVAINGFGRIGRLVLRALYESHRQDIQVVAINDLSPIDTIAHLLKYDSVHGSFPGKVSYEGDILSVFMYRLPLNHDGVGEDDEGFVERLKKLFSNYKKSEEGGAIVRHDVRIFNEKNPEKLPWKDLDIDIVFECSGIFRTHEKASMHRKAGARYVMISAPSPDADLTVVFGVNHHKFKKDEHFIISNASCTTNCLAPVVYLLNKHIGIEKGYMTTIHSYTSDQNLVDSLHSDLRRARAAALSMIPTSTGAAQAVGLVLPEMDGLLDGTAIRVPTANVSLIDFKFMMKKPAQADEINALFQRAAYGELKGILAVSDAPLVSCDFNHNPHSSIVDLTQTQVIDGNFGRILSWYDNEWGFSNRMLDMAAFIGSQQ